MSDQKTLQRISDEVSEKPDVFDVLVDAEMRRIRCAILSSDDDSEDLITYAKMVVNLRISST